MNINNKKKNIHIFLYIYLYNKILNSINKKKMRKSNYMTKFLGIPKKEKKKKKDDKFVLYNNRNK